MSEPKNLSPTKRRRSPGSEPAAKLRRRPSEARLRRAEPLREGFFAGLSEQHLTRNALERLDASYRAYDVQAPNMADVTLPVDLYYAFLIPAMLDDLRQYALGDGLDSSDLRAYPSPPAEHRETRTLRESNRSNQSGSSSTLSTPNRDPGPYDINFQQHLADCRILYLTFDTLRVGPLPRPDNIKDIIRTVGRKRSPSLNKIKRSFHESFMDADALAKTKADLLANVIPRLEGEAVGSHRTGSGIPFTNLEPLTHEILPVAQPDLFYGAPPEDIPEELRAALYHKIFPSTDEGVPVAPNFFLSVASHGGEHATATRQACYHGALGARGIQSLQSFKQPEPDWYNKAYTLTSTYHRGRFEMYAVHLTPPLAPGHPPGYAMTPVGSWDMVGSPTRFRRAMMAWRNGRDWAQKQRDEIIKLAGYVAREWTLS